MILQVKKKKKQLFSFYSYNTYVIMCLSIKAAFIMFPSRLSDIANNILSFLGNLTVFSSFSIYNSKL